MKCTPASLSQASELPVVSSSVACEQLATLPLPPLLEDEELPAFLPSFHTHTWEALQAEANAASKQFGQPAAKVGTICIHMHSASSAQRSAISDLAKLCMASAGGMEGLGPEGAIPSATKHDAK